MKLFTIGQQVIKDYVEKLKGLHPEARRIEVHLTPNSCPCGSKEFVRFKQ